jgi:hypothetical protein
MEVWSIKQIGSYSDRLRRSKIALLVADHEASIDIHRVPLKEGSDHPRLRLTTVAEDTETLNHTIGVMWAKFERIDTGTNESKLTRHPFVQIANMPFLVKPPRDSWLVGHDERMIPGVIDCFDGLLSSFYPPDFAGIENVAVILIEDAITIEKYCRTLQISHARVGGDNVTSKQYADLRALLQQARDEALGRLRLVVTRESETDAMTLKAETAAVSEGLCEEIAASLRAVTRRNVELLGPGVLPNDGKVIADER